MKRLTLALLLLLTAPAWAQDKQDYLYYRDVTVPPYQQLREFFDLPDRPGNYEVTLISDAMGPLTFKLLRVQGEQEQRYRQQRSYRLGKHEFQAPFPNPTGSDDLIVVIANSNPAAAAKVSVYVVELP